MLQKQTFIYAHHLGITIFSGSLYAVCFFPPVVFGLYGRIAPASRVFLAMLCGMATLLVWIALGLSSLLHEVFPGLIVSTALYLVFSEHVDETHVDNKHDDQEQKAAAI